MSTEIDLTGEIATAINGSALRGEFVTVSYVDEDGYPTVSFRGSLYVRNKTQLAFWSRAVDDGLARSIAANPKVGMLYFGRKTPGATFLSIRGDARVDASLNDEVYGDILEGEQERDPERKGIAVIVDITGVRGMGADEPIDMSA